MEMELRQKRGESNSRDAWLAGIGPRQITATSSSGSDDDESLLRLERSQGQRGHLMQPRVPIPVARAGMSASGVGSSSGKRAFSTSSSRAGSASEAASALPDGLLLEITPEVVSDRESSHDSSIASKASSGSSSSLKSSRADQEAGQGRKAAGVKSRRHHDATALPSLAALPPLPQHSSSAYHESPLSSMVSGAVGTSCRVTRSAPPPCLLSQTGPLLTILRTLVQEPFTDDSLSDLSDHVILCGSKDSFVEFARTLHAMWGGRQQQQSGESACGTLPHIVLVVPEAPDPSTLLELRSLGGGPGEDWGREEEGWREAEGSDEQSEGEPAGSSFVCNRRSNALSRFSGGIWPRESHPGLPG